MLERIAQTPTRSITAPQRRPSGSAVETTQIAPTILRLLGLDPNALKSVRIERTQALPLND